MKKLHAALVIVFLLTLGLASNGAAQSPTIQLAFLVDGSVSITSTDFQIMKDGIALAIEDSTCVPHDGSFEITIIQFSSSARTEVPPVVLTGANAATVGAQVRAIAQLSDLTNYEAAVNSAISEVTGSANFGVFDRQVINIATDGSPTTGELDMTTLRQRAVTAGFDEIDAEGINLASVTAVQELAYPQPGTIHPPDPWPPVNRGWVRLVGDFTEFSNTVCAKFGVIVGTPTPVPASTATATRTPTAPPTATTTPDPIDPPPSVPEPMTLILFGGGGAALGAYIQKQRQSMPDKPTE